VLSNWDRDDTFALVRSFEAVWAKAGEIAAKAKVSRSATDTVFLIIFSPEKAGRDGAKTFDLPKKCKFITV